MSSSLQSDRGKLAGGVDVRATIMVFGNLTYYVNTCAIREESVCEQSTNNRIDFTLVWHQSDIVYGDGRYI